MPLLWTEPDNCTMGFSKMAKRGCGLEWLSLYLYTPKPVWTGGYFNLSRWWNAGRCV